MLDFTSEACAAPPLPTLLPLAGVQGGDLGSAPPATLSAGITLLRVAETAQAWEVVLGFDPGMGTLSSSGLSVQFPGVPPAGGCSHTVKVRGCSSPLQLRLYDGRVPCRPSPGLVGEGGRRHRAAHPRCAHAAQLELSTPVASVELPFSWPVDSQGYRIKVWAGRPCMRDHECSAA
jgi:hypothetical protein